MKSRFTSMHTAFTAGLLLSLPVARRFSRKARALAVAWLFSTGLSLTVTAGATAAGLVAGDGSQISGTWNGVSFSYPELFAIKLELETDVNGGLTGQMEYSPASTSRQIMSQSKGSYKVTGRYDAASRTFSLKPGAWVVRDGSAIGNPRGINGILDVRTGELAGLDVNTDPLSPVMTALARDDAGSNLIVQAVKSGVADPRFRPPLPPEQQAARQAQQARAAKIAEQRAARGQPKSRAPANETPETASADEPTPYQPPTLDQIAAWASRIKQEKPDLDVGGSTGEQVHLLARNLFADDSFKPTFGTTYDQLTQTQRYVIMRLLHKNGNEFRSNGNEVVTLLDRPFMYVGTGCAAEMTVEVLWQRPVRGWVEDMESSMAQMSGEASDFDNIAAMESQVKTSVALLWPSESAKFTTVIADNRTRLAVPILEASADSAIASASGLDGARSLDGWIAREKKLLQYVPADEKTKVQKRMEAKENELLDGLVAEDVHAIPNLGHGLDAVNAGNKWYAQLVQKYGFAIHHPQIVRAIGMLQARRADDIAGAASAILAEVDKQSSPDGMKATLIQYFRVPGDYSTKTAQQAQATIQERTAQVQHDRYLAMFSADERAMMDAKQMKIVVPTKIPPPSEDDIKLAVLRSIAMEGGQMLDTNTVHYTIPPLDSPPFDRLQIYMILTIDYAEIEPALGIPNSRFFSNPTPIPGGYHVEYSMKVHFRWSDGYQKLLDSAASYGIFGSNLLKSQRKLLDGDSIDIEDDFQLGERGWWSPSVRDRGIERIADHFDGIDDALLQ